MILIPIVSLNNLISVIICALSFRKVYGDHKQNKQDPVLKDFVWFYIFFGLFFTILTLPGLVLKNPSHIAISSTLSYFFLYVSIGFFIKIPLESSSFKEVKNVLFVISLFMAIFLPLISMSEIHPAIYHELPISDFKIYAFLSSSSSHAPNIPWFHLLTGGGAVEVGLIASVLFFINGYKNKNIIAKKKMYSMGFGMIFLMGATIFAYIINYFFEVLFLPQIIASILAWIGLLIMYFGVRMKENSKEITTTPLVFRKVV